MTLSVILVPNIFFKIADNPTHPLFNYIQHNTCRMSAHKRTNYRQEHAELPNVPKHFSNFSWAFLTNNFSRLYLVDSYSFPS